MNYYEVEMEVEIRKQNVDKNKLISLLQQHRKPPKEVAETLGKPLTLVEHWFRKDRYFAIPTPDVWKDLKRVLCITDTSLDDSITQFDVVSGSYDMRNRIFYGDIAPTLIAGCGNTLYLLGNENNIDRQMEPSIL